MNMERTIAEIREALQDGGPPPARLDVSRDILKHTDVEGRTLLMLASRGRDVRVVEHLLQRSSRLLEDEWIDVTDYRGMTALLHAAQAGQEEIAELLIRWGADEGISDFTGMNYRMFLGQKWRRDSTTGGTDSAESQGGDNVIDLPAAHRANRAQVLASLPVSAGASDGATSACIQQLVDGTCIHDQIDWDHVDVDRVVYDVLSLQSKPAVSLSPRTIRFLLELLQRATVRSPSSAAALVDCLALDLFAPTIKPVDWDPRVMWNGSVLVRASHRVFALQYERSVFISRDQMQALYEDIRVLGDRAWIMTTVNGLIQTTKDVRQIEPSGNNIIGIRDLELSEDMRILQRDLIEPALKDMRAGVAIRVFETGFTLYSLYRADDALDFALEYLSILSEGIRGIPASVIAAPVVQYERDDRSQPWRISWTVEVSEAEERSRDYVEQIVAARFNRLWADAVADSGAHGLDTTSPSGFGGLSLTDLVRTNVKSVMTRSIQYQFNWQPGIFAPSPEMIRGYDAAYVWSGAREWELAQIVLRFALRAMDSAEQLEALRDCREIEEILEAGGFEPGLARTEVLVPADDDGAWTPVENGLPTFKRRLSQIIDEDMEGDWDAVDEVEVAGELRLIRLELPAPQAVALDLRGIGSDISRRLEEAEKCPLASGLLLEVPSMGIYQSFDAGDPDSGNMV